MEDSIQPGKWSNKNSLYFSVALISISIMMLEIGLTRMFSVMFEFHYAFLVLSLAILGLGTGGIYVHKRIWKASNPDLTPVQNLLPVSSVMMALSTLMMTVLITKVTLFQHIYLAVLAAFIPFFFGGVFLSAAFRLLPERSSQVYAADLIGASIGTILILAMLKIGPVNVNLLVALLVSIPAGLLSIQGSFDTYKKRVSFFLTGILFSIFILNTYGSFFGTISLARGAHKEMFHLLEHPEREASVIESRWSAFGRTDLVADEKNPDEKIFFIDGSAGTAMYRFDKDINSLDIPEFNNFSGYFPFKLLSEKEKEKVLIIGSGGGREVLISLKGGAKNITAVEVNADLVDLMKKYSDFNGGIYNDFPGVKVVVEEGRNFIRAGNEKYDIIMLSIPVTKTSRSPEGFSLTENFLFTVESISDYFDRLNDNGRLIVVAHNDMEIFRLVFTSLSALSKMGITPAAAMKHIYTLGPEMFPVFVLKKSPISPQEAQKIHENMHEHGYSTHTSFIPFVEQVTHAIPLCEKIYVEHEMLNRDLYLISKGEVNPAELTRIADFDLSAVTDNNPFFYKFDIGLPLIITLLLVMSTIALVGGWLIRPGSTQSRYTPKSNILFLLLFSFIGVGFMLIEIPLIQKFMLFLGQPIYSVAMLLFSLLIGAGIGSWISGVKWKGRIRAKLCVSAVIVGLITGIYILVLNPIFAFFLGSPFVMRIFVSFLLLLPLGFFLGMPFPLGMKMMSEFGFEQYLPRMWGINGIGSVLGSVLSIALAISFGFSYAMALGALLYIFISFLFFINQNDM